MNFMSTIKRSLFNTIFVVSLACLFILQGTWLYYVYRRETINIQNVLNKSLLNAVTGEMSERFSLIEKKQMGNSYSSSPSDMVFEYKKDEADGDFVSQQSNFIQQILLYENVRFNLSKVDSIFSANLRSRNIHVQYQLNYMDSLGNNIESRGVNINKGFSTNSIHIVNGTKVGAIAKISPPVILRSMLRILIVSILIFFFIIACLIYQVNIFLTQNHLHQLRKDLIRTLSHDMKTPLASIHSVLVQLNNGSLDAQPEMKSKFTTIATDQTINLQSIIDQILTVSHADHKQLTLNKQAFDLPQTIHSLIDKFMVRKEKDIEFSEKYDLKDNLIYADSFYLGNAISNLIDNAIKYSGKSVKIDIQCTEEGGQISIHVKDNGFGISEEDQQKIYKPFERGAEIKRQRISGFGLGLSYVKYVIEAHEGTVTLVSKKGAGSEFIITIPTYLT